MSGIQRVPVPGSDPKRKEQERWAAPIDPNQSLTATIVLRRSDGMAAIEHDLLSGSYRPSSRENAEAAIAAAPQEIEAVESFLAQYGLNATLATPAAHQVRAQGTAQQMSEAFGVTIGWFEDASGARFISYEGSITLPSDMAPMVTAVLGLDQRPIAHSAHP